MRTFLAHSTGMIAASNAGALVLQFFTTILVARAFGAGAAMDAYTLAISIPESLQYVLMLATLSIVFTPLFIDTRTQHGENEAWSMPLSLLLIVAGLTVLVIPLLALAMPWLLYLLAPGFPAETHTAAVQLTDLILPGLIYYATAGLLLGICYAYHDFTTAALNTLLLAASNLLAFLFFVQFLQWGVQGLMLGRLCGLAILQIFLLARVWRLKGKLAPRIHLQNPHVWKMLTYLPPYMFGALSGQLELIVTRSLISTLGIGSVAAWGYGQRLADIPMAVLGAAFGTTYLPAFAANVAAGKKNEASGEWNRVAQQVTFVLTPIAVLLITLGAPLIALLFQRGAFDAVATQNSALVLAGLALGLPLRGVGGMIVRALPSFKSRRIPLILSALATGATVLFAFALLNVLGLFGVALASSIGDILFCVVGIWFVWQRLETRDWRQALGELFKLGLAAVLAGGVSLYIAQLAWASLIPLPTLSLFIQLSAATLLGLGAFLLAGWLLRELTTLMLFRFVAERVRVIARSV